MTLTADPAAPNTSQAAAGDLTTDSTAAATSQAEATAPDTSTAEAPPTSTDDSRQAAQPNEAAIEAAARKAFDTIARRHEQLNRKPAEPGEAPPADAEDQGDEQQAQAGEQPAEPKAKTEPATQATGDTASPPEGFDDAVSAMKRDGLPDDTIVAWFKQNPKTFLDYGSKRLSNQRDIDRLISSRGRSGDATASGKDAAGEPATAGSKGKDASPSSLDVAQATREALDEIAKEFGDDGYVDVASLNKVLTKFGSQLVSGVQAQLAAELTQRTTQLQQEAIEQQRISAIESEIKETRGKLIQQYPTLAKNDVFEQVLKEYDIIAAGLLNHPDPSLTTAEAVLTKAVKSVMAAEAPANSVDRIKQQLFKQSSAQRTGQPKAKAPPVSDKNLTTDQRAWLKFNNEIAPKHEADR